MLCAITICYWLKAQDGKIIEQFPYSLADSNILKLRKNIPGIDSILNKVNFSSITYMSDGLKIKGYMAIPKAKGIYPCIIYNRGGNRDFGAITDLQLGRFIGEVSSWGYVVIASQYRGNMGGEGKEEFGGKEVNDILNLIPLLNHIKEADTSRIGMYGWSRGGMMTYLALTKTNVIKAGVIGSGLADAFINTNKRHEMDTVFSELAPGYFKNRDSVLRERSAVFWVDKICKTTPLLIMCGSSDWRVLPDEQFALLRKLYDGKHPTRFLLFEGGQHSLIDHLNEVNFNVRNFLDKYVRDKKKWPSLEPHGN